MSDTTSQDRMDVRAEKIARELAKKNGSEAMWQMFLPAAYNEIIRAGRSTAAREWSEQEERRQAEAEWAAEGTEA